MSITILEKVSLKDYNTFGIEVFADFFVEINNEEEIAPTIEYAKRKNLPYLVLGGGSNVLFTKNFSGIVLLIKTLGIYEEYVDENRVLVKAKAGERWHSFVEYCIEKNYGGIENLSLIPGNVGPAPVQNIGAYGVEVKDVLESCKVLNTDTLDFEVFDNESCRFGYRDSIFKNEKRGKYVILEVSFLLTRKAHNTRLSYGAIGRELSSHHIANPTLKDIANTVIRIREKKLPDPKEIGNAGSFFKNPIIARQDFLSLEREYPDIPSYFGTLGMKVPAAWFIEKAGWRGKQIGNVATYPLQALVIINKTGNATGSEIYDFSENIIKSVREKFGVNLEREVNVL
ncbi:MAG: UDP-N-acetylmuramate dehydrogenase [Bergeyella sp.]|nr:UDP-N-acetylmuramate dehydrogenase [Bergeyella sp.]